MALAALFAVGLTRLFSLRFASGEIYPPGSSRRADPRGTRALHDSLALLPGFRVTRNYERLTRAIPNAAGHTLFLCGYDPDLLVESIPKSVAHELDNFARDGGRVVLAVSYAPARSLTNSWNEVRQSLRRRGVNAGETERLSSLWDIHLARGIGGTGDAVLTATATATELPSRLPWLGSWQFTSIADPWRIVYTRDQEPVLVERSLGRGSLVVLADDFMLSNEGLRHQPQTALLSWLIGPNRQVVFDEAHLGLEQIPGLASLVRRYRLGGAALGLLLLAGLYVWQQAVPFNPPPTDDAQDGAPDLVLGRDAAGGFRNLLRRSVARSDVITLLFERWKESAGRRVPPSRLADAIDLVNLDAAQPPRQRRPLATYQKLAALLNQKW